MICVRNASIIKDKEQGEMSRLKCMFLNFLPFSLNQYNSEIKKEAQMQL